MSRPDAIIPIALKAIRGAVANVAIPILAAWMLVGVLHDRLYPHEGRPPVANSYGPVRLKLRLPGTAAGIPEPLVACGVTGNASVVYIRLMGNNRAKVGVDFWGQRADQSPEFAIPADDAVIEVVCYLPAFFPPDSDRYWAGLSPEFRRSRRGEYCIEVDGVVRLKAAVSYPQPEHSPIFYAANPLGGSLVSDRFTGTVIEASQSD